MIEIENRTYYSVNEINQYIKSIFDNSYNLQNIGLIGEISNFNGKNRTGHFYFSLKDDNSSINCVLFKYDASHLDLAIKNGDQVLIIGNISSYPPNGTYQIIVKNIILYGEGNLLLQKEKLKEKLYKEGIFDIAHKKEISKYPSSIALVTGKNSAASRDFEFNLLRRWPILKIRNFYALVQGNEAPSDLIRALKEADESNSDIIILGRGGGSSEDLSAFDDETLVRYIYNLKTPLISAIGHEINQSLVDLVADKYASTPTGACEIAVPNIEDVYNDIIQYNTNISNLFTNRINKYMLKIEKIKANRRLNSLTYYLEDHIKNITLKYEKIKSQFKEKLTKYEYLINECNLKIKSQNPKKILKKGYAIVYKEDELILSKKDIKISDRLKLEFNDGVIEVEVKKND